MSNAYLEVDADYKDRKTRATFWVKSFEVDEEYLTATDAKGEPVLVRMPCEEGRDFQIRQRISSARNYVAPIINKYVSSVFRRYPSRMDTVYVEELKESLSGGIQGFMSRVLLDALVTGRVAVVPTVNDEGLLSLRAFDDREILRVVRNDDHEVVEVLLLTAFDAVAQEGKARIYRETTYQDITFKGHPEKAKVVNTSEEVSHEMLEMPVAFVEPVPGSSFVRPIVNSQVKIINMLSILSVEIVDNTFTRFVISGVDDLARTDMLPDGQERQAPSVWSTKRLMTFSEENVRVHSMAADATQAESIRKSVSEEEEHLSRNSGVGASYNIQSGGEQSGLSRLVQLEDFVLYANGMISAVEDAENHLLSLITPDEVFVPTVYSRDVLDQEWEEEVQRIRDLRDLGLVDDRVLTYMVNHLIDSVVELPDDLLDILNNTDTNPEP